MASWDDFNNTMHPDTSIFDLAREGKITAETLAGVPIPLLNEVNTRGSSPLMLAAYYGHLESVKCLLAAGANPNQQDYGGTSILMGAAFKGYTDIVATLIEAKADIEHTNHKGQSALDFAKMFGRADVVKFLKEKMNQPAVYGATDIVEGWSTIFKSKPKE